VLLLMQSLSTAVMRVQSWPLLTAPLNGRPLGGSLGHSLLPLSKVLAGYPSYRAQPSRLQQLAIAFALFGVGHALLQAGTLAWETLLVAIGYPAYFILRRARGTNHLGGFWFDMLFLLPVAFWFAWDGGAALALFAEAPRLYPL